MKVFEKANWIWFKKDDSNDEYGDFFSKFSYDGKAPVTCRISCDGDYTLYLNGSYAASNQYGDYEHYKIFDEIDITGLLNEGENTLSVTVWHHGLSTSRYLYGKAGVIFEVLCGGDVILSSGKSTLSRKNPAYESGRCIAITKQLGYGFYYDMTKDDGTLFTGVGFKNSHIIEKECSFYPRRNKKLCLSDCVKPAKVERGNDGKYYLIDLGEETVGLLHLDFASSVAQKVRIDWGEDLQGGHVRRVIDNRTFSVDYTAKAGENKYTNYMLRFGGRYFEIYAEAPIELNYAGLIPQYYPVTEKSARPALEDDKKIYELCLNTLKLCMMEHYVDCPWREQALYAFDSRNQILAGYYAFEDGNAEYVKSNLELISHDKGINNLLSICYPCTPNRAIPSFSLHFFTTLAEYIEYTGDINFVRELYPKLTDILQTFIENSDRGLICRFSQEKLWNFYDWTEHLQGSVAALDSKIPDAVVNLLFIHALQNFKKITAAINMPFNYSDKLESLKKLTKNAFFNKEAGLYRLHEGKEVYTSLANALAVITGVCSGDEAIKICDKMISGDTIECTLSLKCFEYDALLAADTEKYKDAVLGDIRKNYLHMLSCGATSAWETIKGASDFGNAGSLCHGWSSIPIYYYHKLGLVK